MHFIDLFAGCGGLSLGLSRAGWRGLLAIEKSTDAFHTFKHNLIDKDIVTPFCWPEWLPCEAMTTAELIQSYTPEIRSLRGKVDLIAGGPPCQGFSLAGRRDPNDSRNTLTEEYIDIVKLVQPRFLLLENVKGFQSAFKQSAVDKPKVYAAIVKEKLEASGYVVEHRMCDAADFGVPQSRQRFIMIAYRKQDGVKLSPFDLLDETIADFRASNGLNKKKPSSVKDAISDLEIGDNSITDSVDSANFKQIDYKKGRLTNYQKLMRRNCGRTCIPNSLRLAKHNATTSSRFARVLGEYPKGKSLTKSQLTALGTNKQYFTPLHPDKVSRTITTLPDDFLHYSEPRILTVRESARIQSFPDWFEFQGKYTTGGERRRHECPRYSQVGNAVPPLMAEALGCILQLMYEEWERIDDDLQAA